MSELSGGSCVCEVLRVVTHRPLRRVYGAPTPSVALSWYSVNVVKPDIEVEKNDMCGIIL